MPTVTEHPKPSFEIVLNGPHYFPGDVITGSVKRRAGNVGLVSPHASVRLKFTGCTVVRFDSDLTVRKPQKYSETITSKIDLLNEQYTLHDGPLHIPKSQNQEPVSWPFSIPLPLHPSPACVTAEQHNPPFLSLHPDDIETHNLPFTFNDRGMAQNTGFSPAYVEYALIAETSEEHGGHRRPLITTIHINVRPPPTPPIIDSSLHHREVRRMIQTHRLTHPTHHLNLLQKTKEVFQLSGKVPYYLFNVQVDYPTAIQLDSPSPLPFFLRIGPAREGDVNAPPTVFANSLTTTTLPFH